MNGLLNSALHKFLMLFLEIFHSNQRLLIHLNYRIIVQFLDILSINLKYCFIWNFVWNCLKWHTRMPKWLISYTHIALPTVIGMNIDMVERFFNELVFLWLDDPRTVIIRLVQYWWYKNMQIFNIWSTNWF